MMKIPDSISAMVYTMRHPHMWTLMVWAIAAIGYWLMCSASEDYVPLAFVSMACIGFVGAMPLIKNDSNTLHWVCGIGGCVLSQVWCVVTAMAKPLPAVGLLVTAWAVYGVVMVCARGRKWCFWLEVWCMAMVVMVAMA